MNRILGLSLVLLLSSCSLFSEYRKRSFRPESGDAFGLLVPKKWQRSSFSKHPGGGNQQVYEYGDGSVFYVLDGGVSFNPYEKIDTARHIPLAGYDDAVLYKGVMPSLLYWREVQRGKFRFGYRNVSSEMEIRFDSAVNYAVEMRPVQKLRN